MQRKLSPAALLTILTGLNLLNYFDRFIVSAVLESIKGQFTLTDSQTGFISMAFMLGYFVTSPFFGYLGDRLSRKWLIAVGILVWSLGTVLTGYATDYGHLIACRILVGVGEASYATMSPGLISDSFAPAQRNNALTIFYVAIPLGAAFGTLFGSWAGAHHGWPYAFIWAGLPGLLLAFSLLPFREPLRGESEGKAGLPEFATKPSVKDIFGLFKIPSYNLVVGGYIAYTFAMGAYVHWGQAFLQRIHHLPQQTAGNFFGGVMVVAGLVGTFLGGFAATAWQKRNSAGYAFTLGLSVLVAVPLAFLFATLSSANHVMVCMAVAMFCLFLSTGPVNTVIIEAVPVNLRASAMALSIFMIHLFGDVWSPFVVGAVSDRLGSLAYGLMILPGALLLCAVLWLALAARIVRLRRRVG